MLRLDEIHKQFDNGFTALASINLRVQPGEVVSLVGTSGCGKSTLLRIISGLDTPTSGGVWIGNQAIIEPHPEIGIIFQEPRLMPWLTVQENVKFGLRKLVKAEQERLAHEAIAKVGLVEFAQALPRQLSGGMAQRAAIARALVTQPSILLLDEPFSALDAFTRMKLQEHLLEIWQDDQPTMILVTHDIEEALVLSDRVVVMRGNPGRIHQEFVPNLPRPRKRTELSFQHWKERLLSELDLSFTDSPLAEV
ncbi:ABC transporter ATP-binding protein [Leptolyngbya sp. FACHB-261]|uniref:ABC transporter ATP-binding protein n=1 Tax=Leptolyngbya sp. FACHB-261 TaxID=2692806 RepID=UPI0016880DBF|nr:ABC transporter ATP-binding protein [Leptolyngbya sp. FACHB-261]MBD2104193.1 ABC transporter ATP-binding protein [Leptolyngbya sp. FACHB-261]